MKLFDMQSLNLSVVHRILLINMLNEEGKSGGSLSEINKLLKFIDRFEFSPEEKKDLNIRMDGEKVVWNLHKDGNPEGEMVDVEKAFEITDEQFERLKEIFKKKDEAKEFTAMNVGPIFHIAKQIGYQFE